MYIMVGIYNVGGGCFVHVNVNKHCITLIKMELCWCKWRGREHISKTTCCCH